MAKCGGVGQACSCVLIPGANVDITGTGTVTNPYRISARPLNVQTVDTETIDLHLTGDGSATAPWTISADFVGDLEPPEKIDAESRVWSAGAVSLADVTTPRAIRVTMSGNVTAVTMPTWASSESGIILLILAQDATGSRTWVMPGTSAGGTDIVLTTTAAARDVIEARWTGVQWVLSPVAMNVY